MTRIARTTSRAVRPPSRTRSVIHATTAYDAAGLPVALTDELGHTTSVRRDSFGRIVDVTDPLGHATSRPAGQPTVSPPGANRPTAQGSCGPGTPRATSSPIPTSRATRHTVPPVTSTSPPPERTGRCDIRVRLRHRVAADGRYESPRADLVVQLRRGGPPDRGDRLQRPDHRITRTTPRAACCPAPTAPARRCTSRGHTGPGDRAVRRHGHSHKVRVRSGRSPRARGQRGCRHHDEHDALGRAHRDRQR